MQEARSWAFSAHLARLARKQPDAIALGCGADTLSYGEFDRRVTRLASALRTAGIERGDRVATVCMNHFEHVLAIFAAWRLGAVAVPMNFRLAPPELTFLITDSGTRALVVDAAFDHLEPAAREALRVHLVVGTSDSGAQEFGAFLESGSDELDYVHVEHHELCAIMYTSGTTGLPKGAMLSYENLLGQVHNLISLFRICGEDEVNLCGVPIFHIAGIGGMLPNFRIGGRTVIQRLGAFDPRETLELIRDEGVTQAFLVPAQWQAVCALPPLDPPITTLRRISWGAAPASRATLEAMDRTFPGVDNIAVFGQTEMSPVTCALDGRDAIRKIGSIGKPIPGVEARVVDGAMNDVPRGEVGEIVYRGPTMMLGYWNRPDATRDAFAGGWFHSGDLVREDEEGFLYVVDRLKDMLISGGENVYCAEVEAVIQSHPDILEAAVIGRPDEKWGEVPVVVVAARPGRTITEEQVLAHVAGRLARFKQPRAVHVVDALPRNASGKVTKHALRARYSRAPD